MGADEDEGGPLFGRDEGATRSSNPIAGSSRSRHREVAGEPSAERPSRWPRPTSTSEPHTTTASQPLMMMMIVMVMVMD